MKRINSFVLTFGIAASYLFEAPTTAQEVCGYAPLCGQNGGTFDWRTSGLPISGNWMGGAEISFSDCCSLKDTKPVESCQIVDPSGESYRYYESSEPICGTGGQDCTDGACSQYYFTIKPNFFHNSQNDACCDSCTCYGDPQCKSFNGTEKTWILCDGREIPDEDSIWSMCRVTERRCSKELDHAGNKCQYLSSDPRGIGWLVGKNGSPCVPNPASPPSYIVMYSVPDKSYKVTLQQGERGIILKVILELSVGRFELSADRCLTTGTNAWNITASSNRLPAFFYFVDLVEGRDIMWNIIDPASGIGLNLRCHANEYEGDSNFYVSRINVEDLSDPVSRRNNTSGFCPTGKLDYGKATTEHTKKIIEGDYCTDGLQSSDFRDIYRAICRNSALPESSVPSCIYHFCSQNYAPLYESIEECQAGFDESIAKGFCKGVTYTENDVQKCIDQWFELGAIETIQQYYDDQAGCHTEYQQSLTTCQSGVVIQYWRSNQWNDEIAIPNDYCGDAEIRLSYCDHPRLFNRIIRVVQKQAGVACGPVYQCSTVDAFRALLYLSKDTPYPTPFPTPLVTDAPSPYPTNYPTFFPTSFPVPQPTPFPTNQPTARNPTPFPTPRPTTPDGNVPTPCPQPYLCETPETSTDISDGSFSFEMDSCCPVNGCPDLYTPYQNRSKSSNQGYCQGDESYTKEPCKDDFSLQVKVYFSEDAGQECCKTCTCYGDPRCYSFGNVFKEFILCDGRTVPQSGDTADRCVIRRDTCTEQTDHEGHECKWGIPGSSVSVPNYIDSYTQRMAENSFSVAKHGSPCRYDSSVSGVPNILLYETRSRNFILEVEQGERGYIQTVLLQTTNGNFHLSAERCMDGQDWEVINGRPEYRQFQVQKYGFEYLWKVTDIFTGIEVKVRCTGSLFEGKVAHTFINIESIEEPNFDRLAQGSGFCVSGVFPEASLASTDHTDEIRLGGFCDNWNADVTEIMLREIARVITNNPGVTTVGTENAYKKFCQQFFSPGYSSVSRCVSAFLDGKNVKSLITAFCKAVTVDTRVCEEELEVTSESSGYHDAFTEGYEQYVKMFNEECVLDPRQLPSSLADDIDSCETGVLLQWWNPRKEEWITYSAFRDNSGCAGFTVTYTYDSDPQLFKNKLRMYQQHNFAACSTCTHVSAVDAWFAFNEGDN